MCQKKPPLAVRDFECSIVPSHLNWNYVFPTQPPFEFDCSSAPALHSHLKFSTRTLPTQPPFEFELTQGGLPMYVATQGLYRMKPPTIIVASSVKEDVEQLFDVHRRMDKSELKHNLIGLDVGEEFCLRRDLIITYAVRTPEVALTGDTMSDFIIDEANIDVLRARILVMESTYVDDPTTVEHRLEIMDTLICLR